MFSSISELKMRKVRWFLTINWLILIFSLFYDPVSPLLTDPTNTLSPLKIRTDVCVLVQGKCLEETAYALGAPIFWGVVIPSSIFILLIFGHELWRRICPLAFLSQISRALFPRDGEGGLRSKLKGDKNKPSKVKKDSWLGKNHLYLQLVLFYLGLCIRILFVNSSRMTLGIFLASTIIAAIIVGFYLDGKAWCQYFCPMAPVEKIYAEPRSLFGSSAHNQNSIAIPQSMCRTLDEKGEEISACVACKTPCIDIDAERAYWHDITSPKQQWLYYGYIGLVVGYFGYYFLYSGSWNYYISGAWAHEPDQLSQMLDAGFYILGNPIPIPKVIAVPLTLAICAIGSHYLFRKVEKAYKADRFIRGKTSKLELIRHRLFTLCTFFAFNIFFVFAGRNFILLLPSPLPNLFSAMVGIASTLWLYKTWRRSSETYYRESLSNYLKKQLHNFEITAYLEGGSLESLAVDEIYVLAKVLPNFSKERKMIGYREILKSLSQQESVDFNKSYVRLQNLRHMLCISEAEHENVIAELGMSHQVSAMNSTHRD